jgi:RimJ/RimL family protein N-acetyltransferase
MTVNPEPAARLARVTLAGSHVLLAPLDPAAHEGDLWAAACDPAHDSLWEYLFDGPYRARPAFRESLERKAASEDPLFFAILDRRTQRAVGYASYMRIEPAHRVIEVGSILYAPALQRTTGATEAMYLMARHVFEDLGYRRYEWKCDARNQPSRRAALRLGFTFEGVFRQHMIVKGRNRDTAWFSMLDGEWPERKAAFERWLDPANFENGSQKTALGLLR